MRQSVLRRKITNSCVSCLANKNVTFLERAKLAYVEQLRPQAHMREHATTVLGSLPV